MKNETVDGRRQSIHNRLLECSETSSEQIAVQWTRNTNSHQTVTHCEILQVALRAYGWVLSKQVSLSRTKELYSSDSSSISSTRSFPEMFVLRSGEARSYFFSPVSPRGLTKNYGYQSLLDD